ncbi:hypothetical protein IV102_24775 [bacterium]|nr:hypothetical protein [bacterium]
MMAKFPLYRATKNNSTAGAEIGWNQPQAIEIGLPDLAGRTRLLQLFLRSVPNEVTDLETTARDSEGTSAAFIKELVRRAVLMATPAGDQAGTIREEHLGLALRDLLEHSAPVIRSILGASPPSPPGEMELDP